MLNTVYRLVEPRRFELQVSTIDVSSKGKVLVRPLLMSICRADERYYLGSRGEIILQEKLPMALIHEAMGMVVRDNTGHFKPGTRVAMIPTHAHEHMHDIPENYLASSTFRSSSEDGFMQELVEIEPDDLVTLPDKLKDQRFVAFTEVVSVAFQAVRRLKSVTDSSIFNLGIWGDGNVGFITTVVARYLFPEAEITVFGKHLDKLQYISFANVKLITDENPNIKVDFAIEAVGGLGAEDAISQIIDLITPTGVIVLSGVSEKPVRMNTRRILEKGIVLVGTTRSTRRDFLDAIHMMASDSKSRERLDLLVVNEIDVTQISDINRAFDQDLVLGWGKTVINWKL